MRAQGGRAGPRPFKVAAAFAAIYLIWGSTYLAIRVAIETIPPLLMVATRSLVSGAALYAWARLRGAERPTRAQWAGSAQVGALLFVTGQSALAWATQWVPTGLAALILATIPLWLVMLETLQGSAERAGARVGAGLALGTAGVALLVGPGRIAPRGGVDLAGGALLVFAAFSWAAGSIRLRRLPRPPSTLMAAGMQLLAGGAIAGAIGVIIGERGRLHAGDVSARSIAALAYLVVLGSLVGFTAYLWLLGHTSAARVGTYAYVNPVVAVILGWAVAGEPITARTLAAGAAILAAVALITTARGRPAGAGARAMPPPALAGDATAACAAEAAPDFAAGRTEGGG